MNAYIMWNLESLDLTNDQLSLLLDNNLIYEVDQDEYPSLYYPMADDENALYDIEAFLKEQDNA